MPFENTHLFLADQMKNKLQGEDSVIALEENPNHYYLGSVFPDTLFYSKDDSISRIACGLHGDDGSPTNRFVFQVLDRIKDSGDPINFSFIAGYLTHCAADIMFHPIVFYLSGYKANGNKKEQQTAYYRHWHYESLIDSILNHGFKLEECKKTIAGENLGCGPVYQQKFFGLNVNKFFIVQT